MRTNDSKYWVRIIRAARKHAGGVEGYLAEHGVKRPAYYNWFKKLKPQHPEWRKPVRRKQKGIRRKAKMFVPIEFEPEASGTKGAIEIRLAGGHTIAFPDGVDEKSLMVIMKALGNGAC